jgi:hypothetical protein
MKTRIFTCLTLCALLSHTLLAQLQPPQAISSSFSPGAVSPIDWDSDGDMDFLAEDGTISSSFEPESSQLWLFTNNGSGVFSSTLLLSFAVPKDVTTGDFNNDGLWDVAVASLNQPGPQPDAMGVEVYYAASSTTFGAPQLVYEQLPDDIDFFYTYAILGLAGGDIDQDGFDDLLVVLANDVDAPVDLPINPAFMYGLRSNGAGFEPLERLGETLTDQLIFGSFVNDAELVDVNSDNQVDIVLRVSENFGGDVQVFTNLGGGSFNTIPAYFFGGWDSFDFAQLDADPFMEFVGSYQEATFASINVGHGIDIIDGAPSCRDVLWVDVDLDGDKDIIQGISSSVNGYNVGELLIFENPGSGTNWPRSLYTSFLNDVLIQMERIDIDNDGDEDLLLIVDGNLQWVEIGDNSNPGVVNDERSGALPLTVALSISAAPTTGDLSAATPSASSQSAAVTGEDVWYSFVPSTSGVSLRFNSSSFDGILELQDALGNTLDVENVVAGTGSEFLHFGELVAGATYYVSVRNNNSAQGSGTFTILPVRLRESTCNYGPGPYTLCGFFKATYSGAPSYTFHLTATSNGDEFTATSTSGNSRIAFSQFTGLRWNETYTCTIDANYRLANGAGVIETVPVIGTASCSVIIAAHPVAVMRVSDRCPSIRSVASTVALQSWVCGAVDFEWEFTQQTPSVGLPVSVMRNATDRFFRLSQVPNLQPGATYSVRIRPFFANELVGDWGPAVCLNIAGLASMAPSEEEAVETLYRMESVEETGIPSFQVYPNPTDGSNVFLQLEAFDGDWTELRIVDMQGRTVHQQSFVAATEFVAVPLSLRSGIYLVEVIQANQRFAQRLMVQTK